MGYQKPNPVHRPYAKGHKWQELFTPDGTVLGFRCSICKLSLYKWSSPSRYDTKRCSGVPGEAREVEAH